MLSDEDLELVDAWIELQYQDRKSAKYEELFWSFEEMRYLIENEPELTWSICLEILSRDHSELILANLAAGPIETLLSKNGDKVIKSIEGAARENLLVRKALGAVWENAIPPEIWRRIKKVAGPTF